MSSAIDPVKLAKLIWPMVNLYSKQEEIILSMFENDDTIVPAANAMGKDFSVALGILLFFITRTPCRIVTTSAKDDHLQVLWGEIHRFVEVGKLRLSKQNPSGCLLVHQREIRRVLEGNLCPISHIIGMVSSEETIAAMQGYHANPLTVESNTTSIPRTMFVCDESSSIWSEYWKMGGTWAKRRVAIGNTWPCDNFFKHAVRGSPNGFDKGGDIPRESGIGESIGSRGYVRKIIHIKAEDSPNVRLGIEQARRGYVPTNEIIVPGVREYSDYVKMRKYLPPDEQAVILDAVWVEGHTTKLFPLEWLLRAERLYEEKKEQLMRDPVKWLACDPAEGGNNTSWCIGTKGGIIKAPISLKTPDTTTIPLTTIQLMREWDVPAERVYFDAGGGKVHADRLRAMGYDVKVVSFGGAPSLPLRRGITPIRDKVMQQEERSTYVNKRAEMYGELSNLIDPADWRGGYAIPGPRYGPTAEELRRQLLIVPKILDGDGRLKLPPKRPPHGATGRQEMRSMLEMLGGNSPDEMDAAVMVAYAPFAKSARIKVGAV